MSGQPWVHPSDASRPRVQAEKSQVATLSALLKEKDVRIARMTVRRDLKEMCVYVTVATRLLTCCVRTHLLRIAVARMFKLHEQCVCMCVTSICLQQTNGIRYQARGAIFVFLFARNPSVPPPRSRCRR